MKNKYLIQGNDSDYILEVGDELAELRYDNNKLWTKPNGLAAKLEDTGNGYIFTNFRGQKAIIDYSDMWYIMLLTRSLREGEKVEAIEIGEKVEL